MYKAALALAATLMFNTVSDARDYHPVSADNLAQTPQTYADEAIEIRNLKCYYPDNGIYRCFKDSKLIVYAHHLRGGHAAHFIRENCENFRIASLYKTCLFTLGLTFSGDEIGNDYVAFFYPRTIIRVNQATILYPLYEHF